MLYTIHKSKWLKYTFRVYFYKVLPMVLTVGLFYLCFWHLTSSGQLEVGEYVVFVISMVFAVLVTFFTVFVQSKPYIKEFSIVVNEDEIAIKFNKQIRSINWKNVEIVKHKPFTIRDKSKNKKYEIHPEIDDFLLLKSKIIEYSSKNDN